MSVIGTFGRSSRINKPRVVVGAGHQRFWSGNDCLGGSTFSCVLSVCSHPRRTCCARTVDAPTCLPARRGSAPAHRNLVMRWPKGRGLLDDSLQRRLGSILGSLRMSPMVVWEAGRVWMHRSSGDRSHEMSRMGKLSHQRTLEDVAVGIEEATASRVDQLPGLGWCID